MRFHHLIAATFSLSLLTGDRSFADEPQKDVQQRVKELLDELGKPDPPDRDLNGSYDAYEALEKIGAPATPQLVEIACGRETRLSLYCVKLLTGIGKPALPAVRAKWADLNDEKRWRLMPIFEKSDLESVREYAWNCLDSKGPVRVDAWQFMMRTKDSRAEERYYRAIAGEEPAHIRLQILPGETRAYDEKRENDILIHLLARGSWVAKGAGQLNPDGDTPPWWPDARPEIIQRLVIRKVGSSAPALLTLLREKGEGRGYLAESVVPALVAFKCKGAIPELTRIASSEPKSGKVEEHHPYGAVAWSYKSVRKLATDAIKELEAQKN